MKNLPQKGEWVETPKPPTPIIPPKHDTCPMCDAPFHYKKYRGTHIWICEDCPIVMFEFYGNKDLKHLTTRLR